jgi:hypothetical protein
MSKSFGFFAAMALSLGAMLGGAQAKMVHYEINGQRYSYSTNNRQQVEEARRRISAANAAEAARAKAEAERTANPLVKVFGSQAQREAAEAQARLQQLLGSQPGTTTGLPSPRGGAATARAEPAAPGNAEREPSRPKRRTASPAEEPVAAAAPKGVAAARSSAGSRPATVQAVHFDPDSGIKTVYMTDGTVHEEPFDGGTLSGMGASQDRTPPEDTTAALQKPAVKAPPRH